MQCVQLNRWLDERFDTVYSKHPGYQEGAGPLTLLEQPLPVDVPDTLRGEQWAFVQLPLSGIKLLNLLPAALCTGSLFLPTQLLFASPK
jgi:hypothetical protein